MAAGGQRRRAAPVSLFIGLCALVYVPAMEARRGPELLDDGAFFLRYAENMLHGEFWIWNPGEAPVWGASAPLYPVVLAPLLGLGLDPVAASVATGFALTAVAFAIVGLGLARRVGFATGLAFLALSALDTPVMYFAGSGMESPLTYLLLGLGVWALLGEARAWALGVLAGLLAVHKVDLLPAGGLLLVAQWVKDRRLPLPATVVAVAVATAWYAFAWIYFGTPLPNSFLTKMLHQDALPKIIDWRWFGGIVLGGRLHPWLIALSAMAVYRQGRPVRPLAIFLGGTLAIHLVAYTAIRPFESYGWYAMPSVFALLVLGSLGTHSVARLLTPWFTHYRTIAVAGVQLLIVGAVIRMGLPAERRATAALKDFSAYQEVDRAAAGRWVNENTPGEFRVLTMWGNPAYFARRYVYDGSFLNRPYEGGDLIERYRPEVIVLQGAAGTQPSAPEFPAVAGKDYEVVQVFDRSHLVGLDYFFAVLARRDVSHRVAQRERLIDPMRFVREAERGDGVGILKTQGRQLFVHPGRSTPTEFELDVAALLAETGRENVQLVAYVAPNVPAAAIGRGAARLRVAILRDGGVVRKEVVAAGRPLRAVLEGGGSGRYRIVVDNDGNPDTDWLLISLR
jgi:hypothetical protein